MTPRLDQQDWTRPRRLQGRTLVFLRALWLGIVSAYIIVYVAGIPPLIEQYNSLTGDALQIGFIDWSASGLRTALEALQISTGFMTVFRLLSELAGMLAFAGLGLLLFWRRSDEWIGLFTSLFLVTFGLVFSNSYSALKTIHPALSGWLSIMVGMPWFMFYLFFYTFPDGRFTPRWMAVWAVILLGLILIAWNLQLPDSGVIPSILVLFLFGSAVYAQVYRFIRVSDPAQRAQVKWVMYAILIIALFEFFGQGVLRAVVPAFVIEGPARLRYELGLIALTPLFAVLPAALTIAILRYRLWDIDVLIRKTLVYSVVTGLLALVYLGGVLLLQSLFARLGAGQSPAALVLSTLLIAALFNPLRRRVQEAVDRRFYRRKYDAEGVLAAFAAQARDEVDIERLSAALVGAVEETVQPVETTLWLRRIPGQPGRAQTPANRDLEAGMG